MDLTPVFTAAVSAGAGLTGAALGYVGTQRAARGNRDADRRKRSVDRLVEALDRLETAYADYALAENGSEESRAGVRLRAEVRHFDQAVGLINHRWIRQHAANYGGQLETYYLFGDTELDDLDSGVTVPSAKQLKASHGRLTSELRSYESTM